MSPYLLPIIAIILGLFMLNKSANIFIDTSVSLSSILGMPTFIIGIVIIGFGTSVPELVISALASIQGQPGISIGNAYGSNIANIGLILGISALLMPLIIKPITIKKELVILLAVTLVSVWLLSDNYLSRIDGIILLLTLTVFMVFTVYFSMKQAKNEATNNFKDIALHEKMDVDIIIHDDNTKESSFSGSLVKTSVFILIGLVGIILSSHILVWGASEVAFLMGINELIIGLTIVAVGTSLPELASAIVSIRKKHNDLVLGNVIGSNFFNTLAVVGVAGAIHPLEIQANVLYRDMSIMTAMSVFILVLGYKGFFNIEVKVGRFAGAIFLSSYATYILYLLFQYFP